MLTIGKGFGYIVNFPKVIRILWGRKPYARRWGPMGRHKKIERRREIERRRRRRQKRLKQRAKERLAQQAPGTQ